MGVPHRGVEDQGAQTFDVAGVRVTSAVDEEGGSGVDAAATAALDVALDSLRQRRVVEVGAEPDEVEADGRGMCMQRLTMEHSGVSKELIMHLPEFPLSSRRFGGARGERGAGMLPAEREMSEDESQRPRELIQKPNEYGERPGAIQALEVSVFDHRDEGGGAPANVVGIGNGIRERWTTEQRAATGSEWPPRGRLVILGMHSHRLVFAPPGAASD